MSAISFVNSIFQSILLNCGPKSKYKFSKKEKQYEFSKKEKVAVPNGAATCFFI